MICFNLAALLYRLSITVDDTARTTAVGTHRGKKTKTDSTFGYFLGGIKKATVDDIDYKANSPTWQRFIGCMSEVYIQNIMVDFALSRPEGGYADYSACSVMDPDITTTTASATTASTIPDPSPRKQQKCLRYLLH